jgi:nucleoside-diphosphate-sugar epimerase
MKVAVTGSTGFIGSRLVERLLQKGDQVLLLARDVQFVNQSHQNLESVMDGEIDFFIEAYLRKENQVATVE